MEILIGVICFIVGGGIGFGVSHGIKKDPIVVVEGTAKEQQEVIKQLTDLDLIIPICNPEQIEKPLYTSTDQMLLCRYLACLQFSRGIDSKTGGNGECEHISNIMNKKGVRPRTVSSIRNRHSRLLNGVKRIGKNRCQLCGERRNGHTCKAKIGGGLQVKLADAAIDVLATTACIQPHLTNDMDTVFSVADIADSVSEALSWYDNMVIEVTQHAKGLTKVR